MRGVKKGAAGPKSKLRWAHRRGNRHHESNPVTRFEDVVREYAQQKGLNPEGALTTGMEEKAQEFREAGGKIYQEA